MLNIKPKLTKADWKKSGNHLALRKSKMLLGQAFIYSNEVYVRARLSAIYGKGERLPAGASKADIHEAWERVFEATIEELNLKLSK